MCIYSQLVKQEFSPRHAGLKKITLLNPISCHNNLRVPSFLVGFRLAASALTLFSGCPEYM